MPAFGCFSRSARARSTATEYAPDGSAVASERSPLISALPALAGGAGALVTGGCSCNGLVPSTGTSMTVVRDDDPAPVCGDGFDAFSEALVSLPSERLSSDPTKNARITSTTNAPAPRSRLRTRLSAGGVYGLAIGGVVDSAGRGRA